MEIVSKETIKPSSPTPNHLKTLHLSMLDQLTMHAYIPIVVFYKSETRNSIYVLKKSLSETLTKYYPFAGRLQKDGIAIDCGDQGVVFMEAKMSGCTLHDFLKNPKYNETQRFLFPEGFLWKGSCVDETFVAVQVTSFEGAGMAVSFAISHKVADGCTYGTFLSDWAAMARGEVRPDPIILAKLFPLSHKLKVPENLIQQSRNCVTKRYVFGSNKIAELKESVAGLVENPTSVEVVTAHIYMCAIAASIAKTGSFRKSTWVQLMNMRPRMKKPLPDNCIGNLTWYFTIANNDNQTSLTKLVLKMKKAIRQLSNGSNNVELTDWLMDIKNSTSSVNELLEVFDDVEVYKCSSMVRSPLYELDFGWGNPAWVTIADAMMKNTFLLFDTPDGDGIEAVVSLEEENMRLFQCLYNIDIRRLENKLLMSHL